ncbi:helix-turn-helix transcriptional regulator [Agromyces sp. SYSU T00266]|uniref:helix-turn-helix transcriptional regulator n=1 Tax=Agromyces zhanjiangensis TaxID=3158562 RepID=UPI0033978C8B
MPPVLGRTDELERLGALLGGARNGRGGALLIRGEPGIGKSTILDEAVRTASGLRVVRADGYEAEAEMPFAGLQRLGAPFAGHLASIPPRQATALRIAVGLDRGEPPDRFLVGLGTLSLLAAAGEVEPVVCVLDDAHFLDPESFDVLAFVARRLHAERAALLLAGRADALPQPRVEGVPTLELAGLGTVDAVRLLTSSAPDPIDPYLAVRIADETGGNPLALIDLAHELTASELTASSLSEAPAPIGHRLEEHYLSRLAALPTPTRRWLLVAAAESTGDESAITAAALRLGLPADASSAAELAGIVSVRDGVAFRHPLVRLAAYNGMPAAERRRVHDALSELMDERGHPDLAAWHAASATTGPDAAVADRMELAADSAGGRGGTASRARLLARAAELTPDGPVRDARLLAAAEAAMGAGAAQLALELLARIDVGRLDAVGEGRRLMLGVGLAHFVADADGILSGAATMLRAAELFHGRAPELEQRALIVAFQSAMTAEWALRGTSLAELGRRATEGAEVAEGLRAVALRAIGAHIGLPYAESLPVMRAALDELVAAEDAELLEFGSFVAAITVAAWDERTCLALLERIADAAREAGSLQAIDTMLWLLSLLELERSGPAASGRYVEQVRELRRAIGWDAEHVVNAAYLAWSGAPPELVEQIAGAILQTGFAGAWTLAMNGLGVREIADGHYRDAFHRFEPMVARDFLQVTAHQLPELVEAGARSGHADAVRGAVAQLEMFAAVSGTPWIRGLAERSAALLADDDVAETHYVAAIDHLRRSTAQPALGRAHLVYGEWLRRMKRRREAREQLRLALDLFTRIAAPAFAARARRELEATGEHVPHREPGGSAAEALTPQEETVARMAAEGRTNAEIGATLFISVNTVDYHLRKVFRKLGVASRRQLAEQLPIG